MNTHSKIYVAGHTGMVGSAICRSLKKAGYENIICKTSSELDLRNQRNVNDFFNVEKPDFVFLVAGKVGGIAANKAFRAEFIYDNLIIQNNVIHSSYINGVKKLLFLASSSIYPKDCLQPIKEEFLLNGDFEETNRAYTIAKISGLKLCESYNNDYGCNFITGIPCNLYGPSDNYDLENGHVLASLLRKFITATCEKAPSVVVWGTGTPYREFMHVDDLASACIHIMKSNSEFKRINIGTGKDISISNLARLIQSICEFKGEIIFDESKPDGVQRKLLDISKLNQIGWSSSIQLETGLHMVCKEIKNQFCSK